MFVKKNICSYKRTDILKMEHIKFLECFFKEPSRWYHLREYARINRISPSTAITYLNEFCKNGLLKKKKEHNLSLYKGEDESENFRDMKIFWNIQEIKNSGVLNFLEKEFKPAGIILFGSVSKGLDSKESDIDLFIMSSIKREINLEKFEKLLKRKIQIFVFNQKELKEKKELSNNILNGIVLKGYIEVF